MIRNKLSDREKTFVDQLVKTDDVPYAAHKAGYIGKKVGYEVAKRPLVQTAIENRQSAFDILCEALPRVVKEHSHRLMGENGHEKPSHEQFFKGAQQLYNAVKALGISLPDISDPENLTSTDFGRMVEKLTREAEWLDAQIEARRKTIDGIAVVDEPDPLDDAPQSSGAPASDIDVFQ